MSDHPNGFCVKVPKRFQGLPEGIGALASSREPASLAAIERAAVEAVRNDPFRSYEWVQFGDTPLPSSTVTSRRATNVQRGPLDAAELETVQKQVYNSASWRAAKPERVKGGRILPAERPTVFKTAAEAQAVLDRYRRLGQEAGVPMSGHLAYGVV